MIKKTARNKRDFWMFKAPIELKKEFDFVLDERGKKGKASERTTYRRLGLAVSRHPQLMRDLIKADLREVQRETKKNKFR